MILPSALETALVAIFPPRCAGCNRPLPEKPRYGLCPTCVEILEPNNGSRCARCDVPVREPTCPSCAARMPAFEATRAGFIYGGPLVELIHAVKFRGREDLAGEAGLLLAEDPLLRALSRSVTALVPIPLSRERRRQRGYNQAAVMTRVLARKLGLPVAYALERTRNTKAQSDLPLDARRLNVANAFVATARVDGHLLLVDDVVTSGETVRAAALALVEAGAESIRVAALARAVLA